MSIIEPGMRVTRIRQALEAAFAPESLEIRDDSAAHVGHPGAREGGHFHDEIIARTFAGRSSLECHRLVYAALADLIPGNIHALSISAHVPSD